MIASFGISELGHGLPVPKSCETWTDFLNVAPTAAILVVRIPGIGAAEISNLHMLRARITSGAVVLLTSYTPDNARQLVRLRIEEVVWEHELPDGLARWLLERGPTDVLQRIAALAARVDPMYPSWLRQALVDAVTARPKYRTVKRWAYRMNRTPRCLQQVWARDVSRDVSPRDFLNLLCQIDHDSTTDSSPRPPSPLPEDVCLALLNSLSPSNGEGVDFADLQANFASLELHRVLDSNT